MSPVTRPSLVATSSARATIDLEAVASNTRALAARTSGALMAVVKADGFGHGAVPVARTALSNGATWLGVTSVREAIELRDAGLVAPVLSWLNPVSADFGAAARRRVDLAVPSLEHLAAVGRSAAVAGVRARVHLHLDVGMARDGSPASAWTALCREARRAADEGRIEVVGVMGHLAAADRPGDGSTAAGLDAFERGLDVVRTVGLRPTVRHLAATAALLNEPRTHLDVCRVGAGLFGIDPSGRAGLRPVMTMTAPVVSVRDVPAGTPVGYGHTWTSSRPTRLALLPVGYADGLPRPASGAAEVLVRGRRCPVVGTISMDQVVVDVGALGPCVVPGEVATVFGAGDAGEPTAAEWATWAGTIEHEVLTGIGRRVERAVVPASSPRLRGVR